VELEGGSHYYQSLNKGACVEVVGWNRDDVDGEVLFIGKLIESENVDSGLIFSARLSNFRADGPTSQNKKKVYNFDGEAKSLVSLSLHHISYSAFKTTKSQFISHHSI
jgi:hypothetical protein